MTSHEPEEREDLASEGERTGAGVRDDLRRLKRLGRYMLPYKVRLISGLALGAVYGAFSGAFPKAVELVSRKLFDDEQQTGFLAVVALALAIPVYFAVRGAIGFFNTYFLAWVSGRMLRDLRVEVFNHLQILSMEFFVKQRIPQLLQRVHNNTARLQRSMVMLSGDIVKHPVTILVAIGVLASINIAFCLFALVLGALCLIPMAYFGRKVRKASHDEVKSEGALLGVLHESLSNIRVVKAYVLEPIQKRRFRQAAERQMGRALRFKRQQEMLSPFIEIMGSLGISVAFLYVHLAQIDFSEFMAIMAGFFMLYEPLKKLGRVHVRIQRIQAVATRVFDVLDTRPSTVDRPGAMELQRFDQAIRYENVQLRYDDEQNALSGIDLTIPRGSVCALVGPSGSGKTSIVNLLLRYYDPAGGRILLDGHDTRDVSVRSLRGLIGLVTQETLLFADTVASNIGFGRPEASREEIVEAAKQAQAHDFIMAMRKQYDTVLRDRGQNLAGGQRQRIAIARAILKDPAILVLDEATSSLDTESERKVQEAVSRLMAGRTVLIIAHRFSTVRHADQIVVLDRGRILEQGAHDELIEQRGMYRRLHDLQIVPW